MSTVIVLAQNLPRTKINPHNVPNALRAHRVPVHTWGTGHAKPLEHLLESLRTEAVDLCLENGKLVLHVNVAVVYVRYNGPVLRELYEVHVFDDDPRKQEYPRAFNGIAETLMRAADLDEDPLAGAHRCLKEELDFFDPGAYHLARPVSCQQDLGPQLSDHYPGLTAVFHRTKFICTIPHSLYTKEYRRHDPKHRRMNIFRWKEI